MNVGFKINSDKIYTPKQENKLIQILFIRFFSAVQPMFADFILLQSEYRSGRITDISGPRQFGTATIRHPRRRFGSSVPTVRDLGTDSSGVGLKRNIRISKHQGVSYLCV